MGRATGLLQRGPRVHAFGGQRSRQVSGEMVTAASATRRAVSVESFLRAESIHPSTRWTPISRYSTAWSNISSLSASLAHRASRDSPRSYSLTAARTRSRDRSGIFAVWSAVMSRGSGFVR